MNNAEKLRQAVALLNEVLAELQTGCSASTVKVDDAKSAFTEELSQKLKFEDTDGYVKVTPTAFLGSENFARVAAVVRSLGGEYVSAGRNSHFRIYPRQTGGGV